MPEDVLTKENAKQLFEEKIRTAVKLTPGQNSQSYLTDDGYILREAISDKAVQDYLKEERYTPLIHQDQYLAAKTPLVYSVEKGETICSIHKGIRGQTMIGKKPVSDSNIHFEELSKHQQDKLAEEIGTYLAHLHNLSADGFEKAEWQGWENHFETDEKKIRSVVSKFGIKYNPSAKCRTDMVVCHGDFHSGNFLIDLNGEEILSGVIDFGEAGLGTPAKDFMTLYSGAGRHFTRKIVESYNKTALKPMTMEELDFHMARKMTQWMDFCKDKPQKQEKIGEMLKEMKTDQEIERVEKKREDLNSRKEAKKQPYQAPVSRELSQEEINKVSQYLRGGRGQ